MTTPTLTIALSKGRIFEQTLPLLAAAGVTPLEDPEQSRKLIFPTNHPNIHFLLIRATDVPTYVQYGVADIGVAGKDVLLEHGGDDVFELLDLNIARCRLMVAAREGQPLPDGNLRVATKFTNITRRYFASQGRQVDLIKLYGSMELAPLVGLADAIVDVVDTGGTLKANGLAPIETIANISSRLIVNKAAHKLKFDAIQQLITGIQSAIQG